VTHRSSTWAAVGTLAAVSYAHANGMAVVGASFGILVIFLPCLFVILLGATFLWTRIYGKVVGLTAGRARAVALTENLACLVLAGLGTVPLSCNLGWHVGYEKDFLSHLGGEPHDTLYSSTQDPMSAMALWAGALVLARFVAAATAGWPFLRQSRFLLAAAASALLVQAVITVALVAVCELVSRG